MDNDSIGSQFTEIVGRIVQTGLEEGSTLMGMFVYMENGLNRRWRIQKKSLVFD